MKCPKCQFNNREAAKFCKECGANLEDACSECGTVYEFGSKFCDQCGKDLKKSAKSSTFEKTQPQSYTPKFLADKILTNRSSIEGERKLVTVLFADVANYTAIAEKLDPEVVHQIIDGCFNILMSEIHRYDGTINQFTGDGVMALFGAPIAHEDHAQRACYAALSIQNSIAEYGKKIASDLHIDFRLRIGINSGPVVVGAIGDDLRMDYTAVGDTTNLASRLQSAAVPGTAVASGNTYILAKNFFEFKDLLPLKLKGKEKSQPAYQLIEPGAVETRIEASAIKGLTQFVGRKHSMAALGEALEKAFTGSGQVVGIVGEAGVGKSRLILELKGSLPEDQYTYLEGRCLHYGGSIAYLPILDVIKKYFDIKEGDRESKIKEKMKEKILFLDENLQSCLPPFQELLSLKVEDKRFVQLEPRQKKEKIFEAVRDVLIRESQHNPLIVVIEDLHWIDKTSEQVLDYLMGWLAKTRIFLVLVYRPEYTHQWGSKSYYHKIGLDQLTYESSLALVKAVLDGCELAPELEKIILARSSGNPLFIEELTHNLLENGSIDRHGDQCVLASKASDIQVPDTIQGIIAARIDRIEDNLKRIMQVASVIGRDFAYQILHTVTGTGEELKSQLLNLQGLEFIYEKSLFPELEYIFKHALTQEVAYNSLLLQRREEFHTKIGEAIETLYSQNLEEYYELLAYHYSKSANPEKAYRYLVLSGKKAARSHSIWEAFRFYKDALVLLRKRPESEKTKREQIDIVLLMITPMRLLGYPEASLKILQEGERLSKELGDERGLANVYNEMGNFCLITGSPKLGRKYLEASFEHARKRNDIDLIAPFALELCVFYFATGEFVKTDNLARSAIDLLEKSDKKYEFFGSPACVYATLCGICGTLAGCLGNFEEGEFLCQTGLQIAAEIGDLRTLAHCNMWYGFLFLHKHDGKQAIGHLKKSVGYFEKVKWTFGLGYSLGGVGFAHHLIGETKIGRKYIQKALSMLSDARIEWVTSHLLIFLGQIQFVQGDLTSARATFKKALKLAQKFNEQPFEAISKVLIGRTLGIINPSQPAEAEEMILQGISMFDRLKYKPYLALAYVYLAELYAAAGRKNSAMEQVKKAEIMFQEMGMDYGLARTQEVLATL